MPSGTRACLRNFDCKPFKESLTKQTVEDAAGWYKLDRIFHDKLFAYLVVGSPDDRSCAACRHCRASTDWFADAQYGLSFHWTAMSQPRFDAVRV